MAEMMPYNKVAVIDIHVNNLRSICRGLCDAGASSVFIAAAPDDCKDATHVVVPGVGAFPAASANLRKYGWHDYFAELPEVGGPAVLGVCLGLQLMGSTSEEGNTAHGLGRIPGNTKLMQPGSGERVPHMGWNEVDFIADHKMFSGIPSRPDFYFVHSYSFFPDDQAAVVATTPFAGTFVSAVAQGNTWAVQFHPEKSSAVGLQFLRNFLSWDGSEC